MKIRKIQLFRLLQTMMESYNAFTSVESLDRKVEAWYDKLQYQNEEYVINSMSNWHGTKMPTAIDILKKCFEIKKEYQNDYIANNLSCEYNKFSSVEEECSVSKSLCVDNWPDKNDFLYGKVELNGQTFILCHFHKRKVMANFEMNEFARIYVDGLMDHKKQDLQNCKNDLPTMSQVLFKKVN